jgi:hypothetical protein
MVAMRKDENPFQLRAKDRETSSNSFFFEQSQFKGIQIPSKI